MLRTKPTYWPSARRFTEAIQCPEVCFAQPLLRSTLPAVDRLGMPLVTSGQFAYVFKLKSTSEEGDVAVRCFRGYLGDRDQRYRAIQQHVESHPLPFLSEFTYASEGILVEGNRFPILFMKWIDGPTLDLYLDEMIGRPEVLVHLAKEWVNLVNGLRQAGIAHGDLQHGNIIVDQGRLRLVDHDGMFVPAMSGWSSSELGHQHYQHPRRDPEFFDSSLDNFSALVIYLSLLALAARPSLWAEHHDENLLFTKRDFLEPATSGLLAEIKQLGPEHARLAEILESAAKGEPEATPSLPDLVSVKSALPAWMTAPLHIESKTKTREVVVTTPALERKGARWQPGRARPPMSSVPVATLSTTYQTIFSGPATTIPTALDNIRDPSEVVRNTVIFAREFLRRTFLWWYWGIYLCFIIMGLDFVKAIFVAMFCLAFGSLTYGAVRARGLAREAHQALLSLTNPLPTNSLAAASVSSSKVPAFHQRRTAAFPIPPASITSSHPIVANQVLGIYHLRICPWVDQISPGKRVDFASLTEALSAGYKPCHVCSPQN